MPIEIVIPPESHELKKQITDLGPLFTDYKIKTPEQYATASQDLLRVKKMAADFESQRKAQTAPLDEEKKLYMDWYRSPLDFLARAEATIKREASAYLRERERLEREAQARAEEEARKKREKLEREAAALEKKGKAEQAQQRREEAEFVPAPLVSMPAPKVAGITPKKRWRAKVTDPQKLILGVGQGLVPLAAVEIQPGFLDRQAQAFDGKLNWPGIECFEEHEISASRRG